MSDLELRDEPFAGAAAQALIAQVQQEYVERYGGPDATELDPDEFIPPRGAFFVGYLDGVAVMCGGWRSLSDWPGTAEIKRMFVAAAYRRRGLARVLLTQMHTFFFLLRPPAAVRTLWMLGFHRRRVRRCECETDMPKPGFLPHTSQTAATGLLQDS